MVGEAQQSDKILADARRSLAFQREGGRRRQPPIGRGSAELRRQNLTHRIKLIAWSMATIIVAAMATGIIIGGIGFSGIMFALLAVILATLVFANFPKVRVPKRADLNTGDVRHMVARTELWLESQRPALPPPAVTLVDKIGTQLDALGLQLETVDPSLPAAQETRKLVGETLPGMIDAYRRIPAQLRREKNAGASPDDQIVESLGKISNEIDHVTRQLAAGALDDLAVRTRYLDYKYGDAQEPAPETH
ncbi:MAG TPA: hypothetical protein VIC34_06375 [Croceibacterium sp.]|jgi:hypothetical protein